MDTESPNVAQLAFSVANEFNCVPWNVQKDNFLLVPHIQAPHVDDDKRSPIDLVCCIDKSSSMKKGGKVRIDWSLVWFVKSNGNLLCSSVINVYDVTSYSCM